jgi:hypothetical protein
MSDLPPEDEETVDLADQLTTLREQRARRVTQLVLRPPAFMTWEDLDGEGRDAFTTIFMELCAKVKARQPMDGYEFACWLLLFFMVRAQRGVETRVCREIFEAARPEERDVFDIVSRTIWSFATERDELRDAVTPPEDTQ